MPPKKYIRSVVVLLLAFALAYLETQMCAQDMTITVLDHAPYESDASYDTPPKLNNTFTEVWYPEALKDSDIYGYGLAIVNLQLRPRETAYPWRKWATNEVIRSQLNNALQYPQLRSAGGMQRMTSLGNRFVQVTRIRQEYINNDKSMVYISPAKRGRKEVESRALVSVIYNPRSAKEKGDDVAPRLLEVFPVLISAPKSKGLKIANPPVWARIEVSAEGRVKSAALEKDYAYAHHFESEMKESLKQWRFAPARENGNPVARQITVPLLIIPERYLDLKRAAQSVASAKNPQNASAQPDADGAFPVRALDARPQLIGTLPLGTNAHLSEFRRDKIFGEVAFDYVITANGTIRDMQLIRVTHPVFAEMALECIKDAKYKPGLKDGKPVDTRVRMPISYSQARWRDPVPQKVDNAKKQASMPERYRYDVAPVLADAVLPEYPYDLLRENKRGKATVVAVIDETGSVAAVRVREASHPEFGMALAAAMPNFKFKPALRNGRPTVTIVTYDHKFKPGALSGVTENTRKLMSMETKDPGKIVDADALDEIPDSRTRINPVFPFSLRARDITEGMAEIEFLVDEVGCVHLPRVVSASEPEFGYAAVHTVRCVCYEPPRLDGNPVVARMRAIVEFQDKARESP